MLILCHSDEMSERLIPTPVMIIVDNNYRIRDACIFEISQDKKQLDDFIKKCLSIDD